MLAIGIDVGGTSIKGAIIRDNGEVLDRFSMPTDKTLPPEVIIGQLCDLVNKTRAEHPYEEKTAGVGIGIPGSFNKETGVVISCPNLPTWGGFELKRFMESKLNLYVKIVNDADAAALGEAKFGAGKDCNYMLMFTLGTGVGGGIVINKTLYNGYLGMGGELGHTVIEVDGKECCCGRKGCMEAYASATALIRDTKAMMVKYPDSLLHEEAEKLGVVDARVAFNAEKRGDQAAIELVNNYVKYLSEGLLNYCNIFRPEVIVLSGGVANEGENLLSRVRNYLKLHNYGMKRMPEVKVEQAQLGYDAGKIGAAALYF